MDSERALPWPSAGGDVCGVMALAGCGALETLSCLPSFDPAGVRGGDCMADDIEPCAPLRGVPGDSLSLDVC